MKKILISQCVQCNSYDSHDVRCRITGSKLMNPYGIPIDCPLEDDPTKNTDWISVTEKLPEEYEPYFGWCDVKGCNKEGCSGGNAWRETGYWTVCPKHADDCRKGLIQPKMKQRAIDRENSRDPITHCLPDPPQGEKGVKHDH